VETKYGLSKEKQKECLKEMIQAEFGIKTEKEKIRTIIKKDYDEYSVTFYRIRIEKIKRKGLYELVPFNIFENLLNEGKFKEVQLGEEYLEKNVRNKIIKSITNALIKKTEIEKEKKEINSIQFENDERDKEIDKK